MKTEELNLTAEELDELCRLYMDCKLSVLEEKELEYILCRSSLTSPSIEEVRTLMDIQTLHRSHKATRKTRFWNWKHITGIAASIAVILSLTLYFTAPRTSENANAYVTAFSHGERLSDNEAITSTNLAMAKADSLMNLAKMTEYEYMLWADDIINETLNN